MGVWGLAPISREAIKKRGCGGLPPPLREAPHYWEHPAGVPLHVPVTSTFSTVSITLDTQCFFVTKTPPRTSVPFRIGIRV